MNEKPNADEQKQNADRQNAREPEPTEPSTPEPGDRRFPSTESQPPAMALPDCRVATGPLASAGPDWCLPHYRWLTECSRIAAARRADDRAAADSAGPIPHLSPVETPPADSRPVNEITLIRERLGRVEEQLRGLRGWCRDFRSWAEGIHERVSHPLIEQRFSSSPERAEPAEPKEACNEPCSHRDPHACGAESTTYRSQATGSLVYDPTAWAVEPGSESGSPNAAAAGGVLPGSERGQRTPCPRCSGEGCSPQGAANGGCRDGWIYGIDWRPGLLGVAERPIPAYDPRYTNEHRPDLSNPQSWDTRDADDVDWRHRMSAWANKRLAELSVQWGVEGMPDWAKNRRALARVIAIGLSQIDVLERRDTQFVRDQRRAAELAIGIIDAKRRELEAERLAEAEKEKEAEELRRLAAPVEKAAAKKAAQQSARFACPRCSRPTYLPPPGLCGTCQLEDAERITAVRSRDVCEWPLCVKPALCSSGNFGGRLVCREHFKITNGSDSVEDHRRVQAAMDRLNSEVRDQLGERLAASQPAYEERIRQAAAAQEINRPDESFYRPADAPISRGDQSRYAPCDCGPCEMARAYEEPKITQKFTGFGIPQLGKSAGKQKARPCPLNPETGECSELCRPDPEGKTGFHMTPFGRWSREAGDFKIGFDPAGFSVSDWNAKSRQLGTPELQKAKLDWIADREKEAGIREDTDPNPTVFNPGEKARLFLKDWEFRPPEPKSWPPPSGDPYTPGRSAEPSRFAFGCDDDCSCCDETALDLPDSLVLGGAAVAGFLAARLIRLWSSK